MENKKTKPNSTAVRVVVLLLIVAAVLMGFFAHADSAAKIAIDTSELSEAEWFSREDIPRRTALSALPGP